MEEDVGNGGVGPLNGCAKGPPLKGGKDFEGSSGIRQNPVQGEMEEEKNGGEGWRNGVPATVGWFLKTICASV